MRILRAIRRFVVGVFFTIGLLAVLTVALMVGLGSRLLDYVGGDGFPDRMVLSLRLDDGLAEAPGPLDRLRGRATLAEMVTAIDRAARDPAVIGLVTDLGGARLGLAQAQELRAAVHRFRASGKQTRAFAESFGDLAGGTSTYYLASAFAAVTLQPSGTLAANGLLIDQPFLAGLLDQLGVRATATRRHEYKGAVEPVTGQAMSAPVRENLRAALDTGLSTIVADIARDRRLPEAVVRAAIDGSPLLAAEAERIGLVDRLGYRADARLATGVPVVDLGDYARATAPDGPPSVAMITLAGPIARGDRGAIGDQGGADAVERALLAAERDPAVKGVILRVDSPGGAYPASDAIREAVKRLRRAGKPVVAWVGDVAASGGYYAAMGADRVVARPGSLTGSVGVVALRLDPSVLMERLGVSVDGVAAGESARFGKPWHTPSAAETARLEALIDAAYADFTAKLQEDRRLTAERADQLARGRVFIGTDAAALGLVDTLGGYPEAVAQMRGLLALPDGAPLSVLAYPRRGGALGEVWRAIRQGGIGAGLGMLADTMALAGELALAGRTGIELVPPWR